MTSVEHPTRFILFPFLLIIIFSSQHVLFVHSLFHLLLVEQMKGANK